MFKLVVLFALVAVSAAEPEADPQWMLPHLKTPSGDTVSVAAAKIHHHNLKAHEYAKKVYTYPHVYSGVYAPQVYSPQVYSGVYSPQVYNAYPHTYGYPHHLGKREAEADSQVFYNKGYYGHPQMYNTQMYNTNVQHPQMYNTHHMYNTGVYSAAYPYTYGYTHHLGKREAEADSQVFYNKGYYGHPQMYNTHNMYNSGVYSAANTHHMYNTGVYSAAYPSGNWYNRAAAAYPANNWAVYNYGK